MKCICVCLGSLNLRSAQKACGSADNPGELHGRVRTHIHTHSHTLQLSSTRHFMFSLVQSSSPSRK